MWRVAKIDRDPALQRLLDATEAAIIARSGMDEARVAGRKVFSALSRRAGPASSAPPQDLPVCRLLAEALESSIAAPVPVSTMGDAFSVIAPGLVWYRRRNADPADAVFWDGHANATIVGPGGLEERPDVLIGATLMAPNVTYVDHHHPPEEVYVALTAGEWWNAEMDWADPGLGGLIYNPPGILHAMRSGPKPFLAIWCLPVE
jgi:hypothetical protein